MTMQPDDYTFTPSTDDNFRWTVISNIGITELVDAIMIDNRTPPVITGFGANSLNTSMEGFTLVRSGNLVNIDLSMTNEMLTTWETNGEALTLTLGTDSFVIYGPDSNSVEATRQDDDNPYTWSVNDADFASDASDFIAAMRAGNESLTTMTFRAAPLPISLTITGITMGAITAASFTPLLTALLKPTTIELAAPVLDSLVIDGIDDLEPNGVTLAPITLSSPAIEDRIPNESLRPTGIRMQSLRQVAANAWSPTIDATRLELFHGNIVMEALQLPMPPLHPILRYSPNSIAMNSLDAPQLRINDRFLPPDELAITRITMRQMRTARLGVTIFTNLSLNTEGIQIPALSLSTITGELAISFLPEQEPQRAALYPFGTQRMDILISRGFGGSPATDEQIRQFLWDNRLLWDGGTNMDSSSTWVFSPPRSVVYNDSDVSDEAARLKALLDGAE